MCADSEANEVDGFKFTPVPGLTTRINFVEPNRWVCRLVVMGVSGGGGGGVVVGCCLIQLSIPLLIHLIHMIAVMFK
jgi:hypothetical protein